MPIQTVGNMELEIAQDEQKNMRERFQREKGLASTIGGSIEGAYNGVQNMMKSELDIQRKKEFSDLLSSGTAGISKFADELGLDPAEKQKWVNIAKHIQKPEQFGNLYKGMQEQAQKNKAKTHTASLLTNAQQKLNEVINGNIVDPDKIAQLRNEMAGLQGDPGNSMEDVKRLDVIIGNLDDYIEKSSGSSAKSGLSGRDLASSEDKLRGEVYKNTKDAKQSIQFAQRAITLGKAALRNKKGLNTSADIALIMSFNKLLDPGSVVREGEYARNEQAQGVFNWLKGFVESMKASGGAKLTDTARRNIMASMESMQKIYELNILEEKAGLASIALRRGGNARNVIPNISAEQERMLNDAVSKGQLLSDNELYKAMRMKLQKEAIAFADKAAKEQQANEADFMYRGPRVVEKVMKNNNLDDSYLQASSLGDDTSSVQNDSATTAQNNNSTKATTQNNNSTKKSIKIKSELDAMYEELAELKEGK